MSALIGLFLLGATLIVLLYRIREHRRTITVPSLSPYLSEQERPRYRRWPHKTVASAGLQLCGLALLVLALGDPAITALEGKGESVLIVIDTSVSMSAIEGRTTRFELARSAVRRYLDSLGPHTRVFLATADSKLTPIVPWSEDRETFKSALQQLEVRTQENDFSACLQDLAPLLAQEQSSRLMLFTDGAGDFAAKAILPESLAKYPRQAEIVGTSANNVALLGLYPRRRPGSESLVQLRLAAANYGSFPVTVTVDLFADEHLVKSFEWPLAAFESRDTITDLSLPKAQRLSAKLRPLKPSTDALALDNSAYALVPQSRRPELLVRSHNNLYLQAAILADPAITPHFLDLDDAFTMATQEPSGAWLLDGGPLPRPLRAPTLWISPKDPHQDFVSTVPLKDFGFDTWEHDHPALSGIELYDVQISRGWELNAFAGTSVLARAKRSPILVEQQVDGFPLLILGFDPKDSDFVLRPAWPLFIAQALAFLQTATAKAGPIYQVGKPVTLDLSATHPRATELLGSHLPELPDLRGSARVLKLTAGKTTFVPEEPGFYEITLPGSKVPVKHLAVSLKASAESRIAPAKVLRMGSVVVPSTAPNAPLPRRRPRPLAYYLVAVAWVLLLLEWPSFHRRVTT